MLPATERLLLGPGPSLISPRVMRAMAAPMLSHPQFLDIMPCVRSRCRGKRARAGASREGDRRHHAPAWCPRPGRRGDVMLAGKIWRIGLTGNSSTEALVTLCVSAFPKILQS
jgi:aspartate aminotransferase-like enzyme